MDPLRKRTLTYMILVWVIFVAIAIIWVFILGKGNSTYAVLLIVAASLLTYFMSVRLVGNDQ
jgi:hypothetical protein